jgi:hypothetical protein
VKYFILSIISILLVYTVIIHPFEVPDENAHYSSLNFLINEGRMPKITDKDNLSVEELETEKIFGIVEGQNKYSYHPDFRMEYAPGLIGKYENEIKSLNTVANRTTYSTFQAATYPPLYYLITSPFYRLVESSDIFVRLFVSRFSSVILTTITILVAYYMGNLIFASRAYGVTLAFMTLFFPMTAYVGSGVNSDNLHNLLFGIASLLALKLIKDGWSRNLSISIGVAIGLDLITKPQAYALVPIFVVAVLVRWRWDEWKLWFQNLPFLLLPVLLIAGWQEIPKLVLGNDAVGVTSYTARVVTNGGLANFKIFFSSYLRTHATEMIVWYWGVFKWFGVIMPHIWWWVANRLLGLAFIGIIVGFVQDLRQKKLSWISRVVIFNIFANLIYIAALGWFDWQFYQEYGRSLGLQPRYYMPLLISQMAIMLIGLTNLGWNKKVREWIRKGIIFFFLGLQLTSFYVQLRSYYDLWPVRTFIEQISQYKPVYGKGGWWYLWFPLYLLGVASTTWIALKSPSPVETK